MSIDTYFGIGKPDEKKEITVKPALADIIFEPKAEKKLYTFDASLRVLRERSYERHPRPAEAFGLICNGLEGRLQPDQQAIADEMIQEDGSEWLSMVMLREGNLLHCYLDPENLVWNGHKYVAQGGKLKHAGEEVYSIGSSIGSLRVWVPIKEVNEMNPALVEKLWSRHYAILPEEIRQNGRLWFPSENVLWPVGRLGYFDGKYIIGTVIGTYWDSSASRGVQQR